MKHLFLDMETMGKEVKDCAVIDCSVFTVTSEKMLSAEPYTCKSIVGVKKFKLSVRDQVDNFGWKVYDDTVKFWQEQGDEARKLIKPLPTDITVKAFVEQFLSYLTDQGKIHRWWTRSNTFDPPITWRLVESQGKQDFMHNIIPHFNLREVRTYIDAKLDYPPENGFCPIADKDFWEKVFVKHDSSWDVLADVLRMQAIIRAENDLEQIKR